MIARLPFLPLRLATAVLFGLGITWLLSGSAVGQLPTAGPPAAAAESPSAAPSTPPGDTPERERQRDGRLPWHPEPPAPRLSSAREMLDLFNVDESRLRQLRDGRPLIDDEQETLWKILYRTPHFGLDKLHAWRREGVDWDAVGADPEKYRIQVFPLRGRVQQLDRVELPSEAVALLEFDHYYTIDFRLDGSDRPVQILSRQVPRAWQDRGNIDQRAACLGLLLKAGEAGPAGAPLYFAAERVAWLPDRPSTELGIGPAEVLAGRLGMDVGLWDLVRQTNGQRLLAEDHEAFYQLLTAVDRAGPEALFEGAVDDFDLGALLNDPVSQQGRLLTFTGTARRVQKILIDQRGVRERFGIDHYYQIDILVPLDDQEVRLVTQPGQTEGPVFRNSYPVHCCVLRLPAGLPDRPDVDQEIRVAGFYFKLWAYTTEYVQSFGREQRQLSPLFVAAAPRLIVRQRFHNPLWGWIGGALFLLVLGAIAVSGWLHRRNDRKFQERMRRRHFELTPPSDSTAGDE